MKRYYFLSLFILITFLNSCISEYVPAGEETAERTLVVIAELEVNDYRPLIEISYTLDNSHVIETLDELLPVEMFEGNDPDPISFRQTNEDKKMWQAPPELEVKEGNQYKMIIDGSNFDLPYTEATSKVFLSGEYRKLEVEAPVFEGLQGNTKTLFETTLAIEKMEEDANYYHLIPYYFDNDGDIVYLDVDELTVGGNAMTTLAHRYGILIDYTVLESENDLQFTLSTSGEVNKSTLNNPYLYFKLNTVSEDFIRYHESISRQYETSLSPFTLPTLTYTNIENGYGLFLTYNTTEQAVEIK